jgi:ribonuclease-3
MLDDAERCEALRVFAESHGLTIGDYELYDRALTHASIAADGPDAPPDYESLEFLGDAVLGLAAAHYLFKTVPGLTPGEYTRMRAALVNRDSVARVGGRMELAPLVRLGRGEEMSGGRQRRALIADCTEALIGAVYLDLGWDTARDFVEQIFSGEFARAQDTSLSGDYKSQLQEYCQARHWGLPEFMVAEEMGPDHNKRFIVVVMIEGETQGSGEGRSKKAAQQEAARHALNALEQNPSHPTQGN